MKDLFEILLQNFLLGSGKGRGYQITNMTSVLGLGTQFEISGS